jgi:hypothetical protein
LSVIALTIWALRASRYGYASDHGFGVTKGVFVRPQQANLVPTYGCRGYLANVP